MVTNYYNASNNFSSPIRREPKPYIEKNNTCEKPVETKAIKGEFDTDKILLLGLLAVLYLTECQDIWLMMALLYLAIG